MKKLFKNHWLTLVGVILGALAGYLYWMFVGCESGTCPITSSPIQSTFFGAALGGLLLSMLKTNKQTTTIKK